MIQAYSQRQLHPYSGQAQIALSPRARAITLDGVSWELHFARVVADAQGGPGLATLNSYTRAAYLSREELAAIAADPAPGGVDERIVELAGFLTAQPLPFPAADRFEYWLLDARDGAPLALLFSCTSEQEMALFPVQPDWTALPAAVMPIEASAAEQRRGDSPVNYQVERLVAERAGPRARARWFERREGDQAGFPPLLLREDWPDPAQQALCARYLERQAPRLLMLHGLPLADRRRMEEAARAQIFEVERFCMLYPELADADLINALRVEARLRRSAGNEHPLAHRRDGVLYI